MNEMCQSIKYTKTNVFFLCFMIHITQNTPYKVWFGQSIEKYMCRVQNFYTRILNNFLLRAEISIFICIYNQQDIIHIIFLKFHFFHYYIALIMLLLTDLCVLPNRFKSNHNRKLKHFPSIQLIKIKKNI